MRSRTVRCRGHTIRRASSTSPFGTIHWHLQPVRSWHWCARVPARLAALDRRRRPAAHSTLHGVVFAILCLALRFIAEAVLRGVRDTRSLVLRAHGGSGQLQPNMLWTNPGAGARRRVNQRSSVFDAWPRFFTISMMFLM